MDIIDKKTETEISNSAAKGKSVWAALAGILLLSCILILLQRTMEPQMGRDSCYYLVLVDLWHTGGFQSVVDFLGDFWFPPLHLFLLVLLARIGLSPESAAMVIGMGCGMLMPLVSFAIARELFHDKRLALAAALLTAVNPSIIGMAVQAQRDVPYLFCAGWCVFLLIAAIRRRQWFWWCGAGGVFGVSMLIRYETAEFLPLLGIYLIAVLWKKQQKWYSVIRDLSLFAASALISMILLLWCSGTLDYMSRAYYRYFEGQTGALFRLYEKGEKK